MWHLNAARCRRGTDSRGLAIRRRRRRVADSPAPPIAETQATIKRVGFGISRITLRPKAASRLDIQTG